MSTSPLQLSLDDIQIDPSFDGNTYESKYDFKRLNTQLSRVFNLMSDGKYRTLQEIKLVTGGSEAAISARLRDLRKIAFGLHTVNRRRRGEPSRGLWEYQLICRGDA